MARYEAIWILHYGIASYLAKTFLQDSENI